MDKSWLQDRRLPASAALVGGALLFPYQFATLQAHGASSPLLLAGLASLAAAGCCAIVAARLPAITNASGRFAGASIATLAVMLALAEAPYTTGGLAALVGLALVQAFALVVFALAARALLQASAACERPEARTLLAAAVVWLGAGVLTAIWFRSSHFVWYWNYAISAILSRDLAAAIRDSGLLVGGVGAVANSVQFEYNMVPAAPIGLVEAAMGRADRLALVLTIAFCYVGPTLLAGAALLRRCAPVALGGRPALVALILSAAIFPAAFFSPLYGMPDIGGVGILATLLLVALRPVRTGDAEAESATAASMIVSGGLLFLLCIFRRWYVIDVPAILVILAINEFRRIGDQQALGRRLVAACKNMALLGAFAALCGFAFYWDRLVVASGKNYVSAYRAYANPAAVEWANGVKHFGYGPMALALAAAAWLAARRETRPQGLAALLVLGAALLLFGRVQGFDVHHYLLILPAMIFVVGLAAVHLASIQPRKELAILSALGLCAAASLSGVAAPAAHNPLAQAQIAPSVDMAPPRRDDVAAINLLTRDLARLAGQGAKVCVISSSPVLNSSTILETAHLLGEPSLYGENLIWIGDVDRRDGPKKEIATCDFAVLATPMQLHLAIGEQQAIAYVDQAIKSGSGIGAGFTLTGQSYQLDEGVEARLYHRIHAVAQDDLRAYFDAITNKPD